MQQFCTYGSVRGAPGNRRPYRDTAAFVQALKNSFPRPAKHSAGGGSRPQVWSRRRSHARDTGEQQQKADPLDASA